MAGAGGGQLRLSLGQAGLRLQQAGLGLGQGGGAGTGRDLAQKLPFLDKGPRADRLRGDQPRGLGAHLDLARGLGPAPQQDG